MKRFLIPALLLAYGVGTAQAGTITQTFSSPAQPVPWSTTYLANQFNPSLGTLTSVEIDVTSNIVASVLVFNDTSSTQSFTNATASIPITLTGPASLSLSATGTTTGQTGTVGPGLKETLPGVPTTASTSTTLTSPGDLAPYIGTGVSTLVFNYAAGDGTYSGTAASGVFFSGSATADASVEVIYNYTTTIPEPSSVILAGIGIVGVAAFGRRRAA